MLFCTSAPKFYFLSLNNNLKQRIVQGLLTLKSNLSDINFRFFNVSKEFSFFFKKNWDYFTSFMWNTGMFLFHLKTENFAHIFSIPIMFVDYFLRKTCSKWIHRVNFYMRWTNWVLTLSFYYFHFFLSFFLLLIIELGERSYFSRGNIIKNKSCEP